MHPMRAALVALVLSASTLPAQRVELATIATSPELTARTLVRRGPLEVKGRLTGVAACSRESLLAP